MSEQRIEQRFVNTGPDGAVYVFPPGARSDGKPSTKEHKLAFNPDGSIYFFPPVAGAGTPPPVTPPAAGVVQEVHLGQKDTMKAERGVKYTSKLPFPFSANAAIQIGASPAHGESPTAVWMAISKQPGGGLEQAPSPADSPTKLSGDVNAGLTIYASLNPTPGRGGNYQATVTPDEQFYVSWMFPNDGGGIVYSIALG